MPSRMVDVSASFNLPLHHKVQKLSSGTGSPWWSRKKGHKTAVCVCGWELLHSIQYHYDDNFTRHIQLKKKEYVGQD